MHNILSRHFRCEDSAGVTITAGLHVTADVNVHINAKYAYYFLGTAVPPQIIESYIYMGAQPETTLKSPSEATRSCYIKVRLRTCSRQIAYPALSIKGIAMVEPSPDMYRTYRSLHHGLRTAQSRS